MSNLQDGYLLIADITGYTSYLTKSELDHAQGTLTSLLELLMAHTRPPLIISRLAGDAVISYGLRENFFSGQTFIEKLEDTYCAFRKAIETMSINNTCRCRACTNVTSLDLKFFVNYGTFGIQRISGHDELVGSSVNMIHRLLKNSVTEKTGIKAYSLITDEVLRKLELEDLRKTLKPHSESYEHLGKVSVWVEDLQPIWDKKRTMAKIVIPPDKITVREKVDIELPAEMVWDYMMKPEFRRLLWGADKEYITQRTQGRISPDSVYLCYHGNKIFRHTILEWQPFERVVTKDVWPFPFMGAYCMIEYHLEPIKKGTRLTLSCCRAQGPLPGRVSVNLIMRIWAIKARTYIETFKKRIEEDYRTRTRN